MPTRNAILVAVLACSIRASFAADAYFVRFNANGRPNPERQLVLWHDDIYLFNTRSTVASLRFLGGSNGVTPPDQLEIPLPAGRLVSLNSLQWLPFVNAPMWVLHLDVPEGVVTESRDRFDIYSSIHLFSSFPRGKVSLPIFRHLTPAGEPQVHLGTDLGAYGSRVNVGIYNAGEETAVATIEVRRVCDDGLADSRTVSIPPNAVIQVGGLATGDSATCANPGLNYEIEARYTRVVVTQPSLSFVSNLNENISREPAEAGLLPIVGLGVAHNERF